jgi:4-hydroxybenzoate polyprenyltransferase
MKFKLIYLEILALLAFIAGYILTFKDETHALSITFFWVWFLMNLIFVGVEAIKRMGKYFPGFSRKIKKE